MKTNGVPCFWKSQGNAEKSWKSQGIFLAMADFQFGACKNDGLWQTLYTGFVIWIYLHSDL